MGSKLKGSLCRLHHTAKEKRNLSGISMPFKTFQPVVPNFFCLCSAEGLHVYLTVTMAVILKSLGNRKLKKARLSLIQMCALLQASENHCKVEWTD